MRIWPPARLTYSYSQEGDVLRQLRDLKISIVLLRKVLNIRDACSRRWREPKARGRPGGILRRSGALAASNAKAAEFCREAESWYRKSLATFHEVEGTSALTEADAALPALVARELSKLQAGCGKQVRATLWPHESAGDDNVLEPPF